MSATRFAIAVAAGMAVAIPLRAEVTVGVVMGFTGPTAAISIPYRNVLQAVPRILGGEPARFVILDDTSSPSEAVKHMRRLTSDEKVDVIIGSTYNPACLAMSFVALETRTPMICIAPLEVAADKHPWFFHIPQRISVMIAGIVGHMKANGVKTVGFIGFADGWGDLTLGAIEQAGGAAGIKLVGRERYQRNETSVTAQVLKLMSENPDAVFIGASGTPAALPQAALVERGYKGRVYQTHGAVGKDFLRVGGKNVEGTIAPTGPLSVADQLPDSNPIKKVALQFFKMYDAAYPDDARNSIAGYGYDAYLFLGAGVTNALKKAKPGTPEFRVALRESMENLREVVGTHAVYSTSPADHNGVDDRGRVMVTVQGGAWKLLP